MHSQSWSKALAVLQQACTAKGILASVTAQENYGRIWSRDSNIAGLAGYLANDDTIMEGWIRSLVTLWSAQHDTGVCPSNVSLDSKVSYGSLAGRVDATTWALVGAGLMYDQLQGHIPDINLRVDKALSVLEAWEFNGRHLIYSPLSGNWADEYPYHGYLLYDNALRYWAVSLWSQIRHDESLLRKKNEIKNTIYSNFWLGEYHDTSRSYYHESLFERCKNLHRGHLIAGFHPGGIFPMFDAAANGLALLLGLANEPESTAIAEYIEGLWSTEVRQGYVPAFWPPIYESDPLWGEISTNYSYSFKNKPHHFHNGGIWPVMMGVLGLGLTQAGLDNITKVMSVTYDEHLRHNNDQFFEYIDSSEYLAAGKNPLCFSAAGYVFLHTNKESINSILLK